MLSISYFEFFIGDDPSELYEKEETAYPILVEEMIEFNNNLVEKYGSEIIDSLRYEDNIEEHAHQTMIRRNKTRRMDQPITHEYPLEWWGVNNDKIPPLCLPENRDLLKTDRAIHLADEYNEERRMKERMEEEEEDPINGVISSSGKTKKKRNRGDSPNLPSIPSTPLPILSSNSSSSSHQSQPVSSSFSYISQSASSSSSETIMNEDLRSAVQDIEAHDMEYGAPNQLSSDSNNNLNPHEKIDPLRCSIRNFPLLTSIPFGHIQPVLSKLPNSNHDYAIQSIQSKHLKNNQEGITTTLHIEFEPSPNAIGGGKQLYTSSNSSNTKNPPLPGTIGER